MILVSFSTLPSRIDRIGPMIESIKTQTVKPDRFVLFTPDVSLRERTGYRIPPEVSSKVEVINCGVDYGPATKLIPALSHAHRGDIIITVDDDVVYDSHLIEELVREHCNAPRCRLGFMGIKDNKFFHAEYQTAPVEVEILGGYRGVLYPRESVNEETLMSLLIRLDVKKFCREDDQLFSYHTRANGYPSRVIPSQYPARFDQKTQGFPWQVQKSDGSVIGLNFRFLGLGNGIFDPGNAAETQEWVNMFKELTEGENS